MKSYVIRIARPDTGAYLYSRTNNPKQRVKRLMENILAINGQGTAVFDRFAPFIGTTPTAVTVEIYKQVA